jgi:carbon storage regulator CsrA
MLIVVRKVGEAVVIADKVVLKVESISRNAHGKVTSVKFSVDAPQEFTIRFPPRGDDSNANKSANSQPPARREARPG